jgi:hypothetical protein
MARSRTEIIDDIEAYVARCGGRFGEWYVGVTAAPKRSLFTKHLVREKGDPWIGRIAKDEFEARDIAEYFVGTRGTQGSLGTKAESEFYVYAYQRRPHTKP